MFDLPVPSPCSSNFASAVPDVEYSCTHPWTHSVTYRLPPENAKPAAVPNAPEAVPNPDSDVPVEENSCTSVPEVFNTHTSPLESTATPVGLISCPGPGLDEPKLLKCSPDGPNSCTRLFS